MNMSLDAQLPDEEAEVQNVIRRYRGYMRMLAEYRLDPQLRRKLDPSDIVQQSMVHVCERWRQFRGRSEEERLAWLKTIVIRNVLHAFGERFPPCQTRCLSGTIVRPTNRRLIAHLEQWLAAEETTPSVRIERAEQLLRIADAVENLSDGQRETVMLFYWHSCTLAEISELLGRSEPAIAGLLHRGLQHLRKQLREPA